MLGLLLLLAGAQAEAPFGLRVDMHAHPSRFHRANVPRIEDDKVMGGNFVRVWTEVTR